MKARMLNTAMTILCAVQLLLFGASALGVLPATQFKSMSADFMLTCAWTAAFTGWFVAKLTDK
jgi:hypothetical protein